MLTASRTALLVAAAGLLGVQPVRGAAGEWAVNEQSRVRLVTPYRVAPRRGELRLGLHFTLAPGWHVYWKNSGDAGFPPALTFRASQGADAELLWPAPQRFELPGDLVAFGYEGEVVYPVRMSLPAAGAAGDRLDLAAELDYLVCEVDCIPYRYTLTVAQPLGEQAELDPATAPLLERWWNALPAAADRLPGVSTEGILDAGQPGEPALEVRVRGVAGQPGRIDLFLEPHEAFDTGKPQARAAQDGVIFRVPLRLREAGKALPGETAFAWTVTGVSRDGRPLALEARRQVRLRTGPAEDIAASAPVAPFGSGTGLAWMLLVAFLGGTLLNAAPTVLALLVPELLALRSEPAGLRGKAGAAVLGTLATCWGAAALAVAANRAGLPAGWGAQLQEPAVAALLALAAAVLALNLWGMLEIPLSAPPGRGPAASRGRSLLAGLWTPLLGLAWAAPPLAEPVGFAAERSPAAALAVFTLLGLGLALPYLAVILFPGAVRVLPASGTWTAELHGVLGFVAGASTVWLLYALARQVSSEGLAWIELALLALGLLAWLRSRAGRKAGLKFALALGVAACAVAAPWLADRNRLSPRPSSRGSAAAIAAQAAEGPQEFT